MKRILLAIIGISALATVAVAQPAKSRVSLNPKKTEASADKNVDRAALMFPTSDAMPEDVVWQRDIYRQLDLMNDKNAPLYYPVEPKGKQVNLFTYIFRLVLTGRVTAYNYTLDMNESFEPKNKLDVTELLERYSIFYEMQNGKPTVADSDVPSAECTRYFLKESVFLDQRTSTFSTRVVALCPVLMRGADDFDMENATPYPLFWVNYADLAPWLAKLPMMGSNLNNVVRQTADDYFTLNRYDGKIFKINNLQGKLLNDYCKTDSALVKEQKRIEKQLVDFEEGVWGHREEPTDSAQQVAVADKKAVKKETTAKTTATTRTRRRTTSDETPKQSAGGSTETRASARRARR